MKKEKEKLRVLPEIGDLWACLDPRTREPWLIGIVTGNKFIGDLFNCDSKVWEIYYYVLVVNSESRPDPNSYFYWEDKDRDSLWVKWS